MNKIFTTTIIILLSICAWGQSWINTPFIEYTGPSYTHDTASVGPQEICITPDNSILMLLQPDQIHHVWLMKYSSSGTLLWSKPIVEVAGLHTEYALDLHPTVDNGCIYVWKYAGSGMIGDSVVRRDANGLISWSKYFPALAPFSNLVIGATQTFYNTTCIQFLDSLVEFDASGNFIRHRTSFPQYAKIVQLPDSNILVFGSSIITKEDFYGNLHWSIHLRTYQSALCTNSPFIYINNGIDSVTKLNTQTGNMIWTQNISINNIAPTQDQGFIAVDTNNLQKYDSAGVLMWSKTLDFPEYGLKGIGEMQDKSLITGGCWKMRDPNYYTRYCPFVMQIDSTGSGIVDSSDFFYAGNANDNNILSFADDAVYIAAALNNSGVPRELMLTDTNSQQPNIYFLQKSIYAIDWSTGFSAGYNYKYADLNGNGLIDTNDLQAMSYLYPWGYAGEPHWNRLSGTMPDLYFHIPNSQPITDSLEIDIILGSPSTTIDSIYGLSIEFYFTIGTVSFNNSFPRYSIIPHSALGDPAVDLYTFFNYTSNNVTGRTAMVLCRNDHQNVTMAGDTIAKVFFDLSSLSNINDTLRINSFANAITAGGFPVAMNLINDSALLSIPLNAGKDYDKLTSISLAPNPVADILRLEFMQESESEIEIYNLLGEPVLFSKSKSKNAFIDVSKLSNGVYFLKCAMGKNLVVKNFIINR